MLPALHGDCLHVEYGDAKATRRIQIDGGPLGAFAALQGRIDALPAQARKFELIVLTHVDTDHIEGIIKLFAAPKPWPFEVKDVWFNGWLHLQGSDGLLGGKQGDYFSALLQHRLAANQWNGAFKGQAIVVRDSGPLPEHTLEGGMKLTLLSPTPPKLAKMRDAWRKDVGTAFKPGDLEAAWKALETQTRYIPKDGLLGTTASLDAVLAKQSKPDDAAANGSAIAFLAEFGGKSCLFLADAHPDAVSASLKRLSAQRGLQRLKVDAVKVAHHGSKANTSDELMALIESPRFLFSTNGAIFKHPDREAVQRVIGRNTQLRPRLYFNYKTQFNEEWAAPKLQQQLAYSAEYNNDPTKGLTVAL
jgi:hypothetical protein